MSVNVVFDLPEEVAAKVRGEDAQLAKDVREVYLVELYRRGVLTHFDLGRALGLDRHETNAYLKEHNVFEGSPTMEDLEADRETFLRVMGSQRQ